MTDRERSPGLPRPSGRSEPTVPTVSTTQLRIWLADPVRRCWLVHATDRAAFRDGHIPGALTTPNRGVLRRLATAATIVVYGEDGDAVTAPELASALRDSDVEVVWYSGGLAAWRRAGFPVERSG